MLATGETVRTLAPDTGVVIELGGEDAKVIFFTGITNERMNGTCAGGTGAFIDQMATLLDVTTDELDELSLNHTRIYPIASRCGVFAKTDIQPLINQGAKKEDIAASIYQAVVNQTGEPVPDMFEYKRKKLALLCEARPPMSQVNLIYSHNNRGHTSCEECPRCHANIPLSTGFIIHFFGHIIKKLAHF